MRFALCGPRRAADLALILEKQGAVALHRPTVRTILAPPEVLQARLSKLVYQGADWVIFTSGAGVEELHRQAEALGLWEAVYARLKQSKLAQRGYKSDRALRQRGLQAVAWDEDGTVDGLIEALRAHPLAGLQVFVQLYGQPAPRLVRFLKEQGAGVEELMPYRHIPASEAALDRLILEVLEGELDALVFTSQPQVDYLLAHAEKTGQFCRLQAAFERVWALAIGHITAIPLQEAGIRCWYPRVERLGALVTEFARFMAQRRGPL
ncbi:uroporphyrinogen-III synthase [Meiothermus sp. QL-1]|uniref:uroporphyrinogen-III synthase n=1 Tax=Meiothermus sp. QL-1 TaxID=2058095 RepID=UPI0013147ACC|nr:uroporphyrinogen-III synthase [Meiothermus sp. QL-1]